MLRHLRAALAARHGRRRALGFYRQFVPRGGLCFDVGANIGNRTDVFLALAARVIAVEPLPANIQALRERFGARIELVEAVLGPTAGETELMVASYHTLSSLSAEWVEAVQESGRFADFSWDERLTVPMLTLDELIVRFGVPDFCKIDVEGYELEVLRGLRQQLPALSFEFTPERTDVGLAAVRYLDSIGLSRFNYAQGESMRLGLDSWVDAEAIGQFLVTVSAESFGDVYARSAPA